MGRPAPGPWACRARRRYAHVGEALADEGIEVHAYDQRGFGRSGGDRAYVDRWSVLHDDLQGRLATVRDEHPELPLVLYGHSMGGLVTAGYVLSDKPRPLPDLLVLSAPGLRAVIPPWRIAMAAVLSAIATPSRTGCRATACRAIRMWRDATNDPLLVPKSTMRFAAEAFREQDRIADRIERGATLPVPTYVFHGAADPIVPTASSAVLLGRGPETRHVHQELRHECHNEPEWRDVLTEVVSWIRANVG